MDPASVPVPLIFLCGPMVKLLSTLISNPARSQEARRIQSTNFCNFHLIFLFSGFCSDSPPHLIFKCDLIIIPCGLFSWLWAGTFSTSLAWRRATEPPPDGAWPSLGRMPETVKPHSTASLTRRLRHERPGRVSPQPSSCSSLNYFSRERGRTETGVLELRLRDIVDAFDSELSVWRRASKWWYLWAHRDKCQTFLFV